MNRFSPYKTTLTAVCTSGAWAASQPLSRRAGVFTLSAQLKIALSSYGGATVTVSLEGTNIHPNPAAADWVTIESAAFTVDGSSFLGTVKMCDVEPYDYLRLSCANAGGTPGSGTVIAYIRADDE